MGAPTAHLVVTVLVFVHTTAGSDSGLDVYGSHDSYSSGFSEVAEPYAYSSSSGSLTGEAGASEDDYEEASLVAPDVPNLKTLREAVFTSDLSRDDSRTTVSTISCGSDSQRRSSLSGSESESDDGSDSVADSEIESVDVYENSVRDRVLLARDRVSEGESDVEDLLVQSMSRTSSSYSSDMDTTPLDDITLSSHLVNVNDAVQTEVYPEKWRAYATIRLFPGTLRVLSMVSKRVSMFSEELDESKVFRRKGKSTNDILMRDGHRRWPLRTVRNRRVVVHFPQRKVLVYKTKETNSVSGPIKFLATGDLKYSIPFSHIMDVRKVPDTVRSKNCLILEFRLPHGMKNLHKENGEHTDYVRFCLPRTESGRSDAVDDFVEMIQDVVMVDRNVQFLQGLENGLGSGLLSWYEKKFDEPMVVEVDHDLGIMEKGPAMCSTDVRQLGRAPRNVVIPTIDYQKSPHIQMAMEQCDGLSAFDHCDLNEKRSRAPEWAPEACSCSCSVYHKENYPSQGVSTDWVYKTCTGAKLSYFGRLKADLHGEGRINVPTAMIVSKTQGDRIVPFLFVKYYNWNNLAYRGRSIVPEELSEVPNTSYTTMKVDAVRTEIEKRIVFVKALSGGTTGGKWPSAFMVKTADGNDYVIKFHGNRKLLSALGHLLGMATPRLCSTKVSVEKVMAHLHKISTSGCMEGRSDAFTLYSKFDSARRFGDTLLDAVSIDVQDLAFGRQRMEIPHIFSVLTSAEQAGMIAAFDMLTVRTDLFNIIDEESSNNIIGYGSIAHGGTSRDSVVNIDMNLHTEYENFSVKNKATVFSDRHYRASLHEILFSVYSRPETLVPFIDLNMGENFHHRPFLPKIHGGVKKTHDYQFSDSQIRTYKVGLLIQLGIVEFAINLLENEETVFALIEKEGDANTLEYFTKRIDRDFKFAYGGIQPSYDGDSNRPVPDDPSAAEKNPLEGWQRARRVLVDLICAEGLVETDQLKALKLGLHDSEIY